MECPKMKYGTLRAKREPITERIEPTSSTRMSAPALEGHMP